MEALLTNLAHAAKDDVFYGAGINSTTIDQRIQHFSCHISRMPVSERVCWRGDLRQSGPPRQCMRSYRVFPMTWTDVAPGNKCLDTITSLRRSAEFSDCSRFVLHLRLEARLQ